ncbi:MAG: helix-turn-helix domain-containing protein [archaeon]
MDKKEFEFLLKEGEGYNIEFKESFSSDSAKEICAFANSTGGKILIGISDNKQIKGIEITNRLKSQIHDLVRNFDPKLAVSLEEFDNILIINVPEGKNKPYSASGKFYVRQGTNSQQLTTDEIREFFQKEGKIFFDESVNKEFSFKNGFSKTKFSIFIQRANLSKTISDEDILKNLGVLTKTGKFKNAGVLFFCDNVEKFFRHAIITCVLYKGNDKYKIMDRKDFTEDTISNYNGAMTFLVRNLRLEYKIETAGPREEILEIPEDALREAIINAMAHRDYNEKGANIQIDIFDNRVEISNPGGLISMIKKEEFGKKSISRNPLLFSLFKSADLVEKIGSGIGRMRNAMRNAGLPMPKFIFTNFFTVILRRPPTPQVTPQVTPQAELTELENKIVSEIKINPKISRKELAKKLGIGSETVKEYLEKLKTKGVLKRVGKTSAGYWEILK